jgi:hypothetical protein
MGTLAEGVEPLEVPAAHALLEVGEVDGAMFDLFSRRERLLERVLDERGRSAWSRCER